MVMGNGGSIAIISKGNSLSGASVIIGLLSKKPLFVGIRNKFCYVCEASIRHNHDIPLHTCFKNWTGTSSSMETSIIVEGFKLSQSMHNLMYKTLIADGDSSMYNNVRLVYHKNDCPFTVEKV